MNGENSMNHYYYNEGTRDYEYNGQKNQDTFPVLMLLIILLCSLSLNLLRCCFTNEDEEEGQLDTPLLLNQKEE